MLDSLTDIFSVLSPMRIYIVLVIVFTIWFLRSDLNHPANWGAPAFSIPLYTLILALVFEVFLTMYKSDLSIWTYWGLSALAVVVSIFGTWYGIFPLYEKFLRWMSRNKEK
jgi:hypothetical protein